MENILQPGVAGHGEGKLGNGDGFGREWQVGEEGAESGLDAKGRFPARHFSSGHCPTWIM